MSLVLSPEIQTMVIFTSPVLFIHIYNLTKANYMYVKTIYQYNSA